MVNNPVDGSDSDDYELLPRHELDELRKEVSGMKKNSLVEGDKGRMLIESIDKLSSSINRLITILDDAQKDIIDEYQESKPAEKINQLMEQNQTIAKALIAINDSLTQTKGQQQQFQSSPQFSQSPAPEGMLFGPRPVQNSPSVFQQPMQSSSMNLMPPMNSINSPPMQDFSDLPPIGKLPPLDDHPKKKFLGFM